MEKAGELLQETDKPMKEIAALIGLNSVVYSSTSKFSLSLLDGFDLAKTFSVGFLIK